MMMKNLKEQQKEAPQKIEEPQKESLVEINDEEGCDPPSHTSTGLLLAL